MSSQVNRIYFINTAMNNNIKFMADTVQLDWLEVASVVKTAHASQGDNWLPRLQALIGLTKATKH